MADNATESMGHHASLGLGRPGSDPDDWRRWDRYDGVLFDLDGVLTPTAVVHEQAWEALFNWYLRHYGAAHGATDLRPFSPEDYRHYVDGKPRYEGVASFLTSRGITLDEGTPEDPPGPDTVMALGNRKNDEFTQIITTVGVAPYPGSVAMLDHLDTLGVPYGVVSSSKNARPVLAAAGLEGRMPVVIDGIVAAERGMPGKPAPDVFLLGAQELGVDPARSVVVEDATSGVIAGVRGGFMLVLGVDRDGTPEELRRAGAHHIVNDLAEAIP